MRTSSQPELFFQIYMALVQIDPQISLINEVFDGFVIGSLQRDILEVYLIPFTYDGRVEVAARGDWKPINQRFLKIVGLTTLVQEANVAPLDGYYSNN